ncbi:hypothetical protein [Enterovibrio norvegicus]|uniref:hypothetical protein n=1 Tax=Enterovibrio norvegicus TaxID=188144 RepID=UPI000C850773|nr:hypothetical protein [Enterovibrio norvegicus]PMH64522.1 hypothetical protein BCU62_15825 [Enterovibrio norvegicus]
MKTCIICECETQNENMDCSYPEHHYLCVCNKCHVWKAAHVDLIQEQRDAMVKSFSPQVKKEYLSRSRLEQGFIIVRYMEDNQKT